jgi:uncharacterized protein with PQ loop repeat
VANIPQIITAYKNRKNLSGLSINFLFALTIGYILFAIGNYGLGALISSFLCIASMVLCLVQIFWKRKYRRGK